MTTAEKIARARGLEARLAAAKPVAAEDLRQSHRDLLDLADWVRAQRQRAAA